MDPDYGGGILRMKDEGGKPAHGFDDTGQRRGDLRLGDDGHPLLAVCREVMQFSAEGCGNVRGRAAEPHDHAVVGHRIHAEISRLQPVCDRVNVRLRRAGKIVRPLPRA